MFERIPNWLKSKYVITTIAFLVVITFINDIDLVYVMGAHAELNEIKDEVDRLKEEEKRTIQILDDYKNNKGTAEEFAREHYYMHKKNEDLYIVKTVLED